MFKLSLQDIHISSQAKNKMQAIHQVATHLVKSGYASDGYLEGMIERENQASTFLGNGIAMPHGTTATRHLVHNTGVQVFQYPQGVNWENNQIAYIVIGIAARSDDHLVSLQQISRILSNKSVALRLSKTNSKEEIYNALMGAYKPPLFLFDRSTITLGVVTSNLMTLKAINVGLLQDLGAIDVHFINKIICKAPLYLGHGLWFDDSKQGNVISAIAISSPAESFNYHGKPVMLLITTSIVDHYPITVLNSLASLIRLGLVSKLIKADSLELITLLTSDKKMEAENRQLTAEYTIRNNHGLHARPGAVLVKLIKQFDCSITITNLDGVNKPINGRSLIKVISLGAKKGHRLSFTAQGNHAEQALKEIGQAISCGLGEIDE